MYDIKSHKYFDLISLKLFAPFYLSIYLYWPLVWNSILFKSCNSLFSWQTYLPGIFKNSLLNLSFDFIFNYIKISLIRLLQAIYTLKNYLHAKFLMAETWHFLSVQWCRITFSLLKCFNILSWFIYTRYMLIVILKQKSSVKCTEAR